MAATHLKDVVEGPSNAYRPAARWPSVPLGSGVVDIPGVVRELAHVGYAGLLCVEIDIMADVGMSRDSAVAASVAYLRGIATKD